MNFKKGILYVFVANAINLIISLFTGFVLPKYLSIETYANIKLFQLYITYIGIMHLGFADGMYLKKGGKKVEDIDKKSLLQEFNTFKIFQLFISIIAIIICVLIKNEILLLCAIVILPINVASYIRNLYNALGMFKKYSRYTNINTICIFIINVILLFIIKTDNYFIYVVAYVVVYFIYWLFIEFETSKIFGREKPTFNKSFLVEDVKSGFPLMIGNFCNVIFTGIDRLFVQNLLGTIKFAYYSFAVSIENLMTVFITPISTVMYNYFCTHKEKENILNVKKMILVFAAAVIAVVFPAKFVVDIWLTKYQESLTVLFLLFAAQYISIMVRCVHVNLYKSEKKQNRYFIIMAIVVGISVILNIIAYNIYPEIISIAIATLITNIIWFIVGEIDFKDYRLKIQDYIYVFSILILFLLCGMINNAIIGFVVYAVVTIAISMIIERKTVLEFIGEGVKFLRNRNVLKNEK